MNNFYTRSLAILLMIYNQADVRGPAGRMSLLLLVEKVAALSEFRTAADRMRAIRDVIDPLCGLKAVYLYTAVGLAACVLKAVRT